MSNRFRSEIKEEEEEEIVPEVSEKSELPKNIVTQFFTEGFVSKQAATETLPFVIFLAFLAMVFGVIRPPWQAPTPQLNP